MPHVAFVSFSGVHVRETELAELGMTLPGLSARAEAISQLPALGLLTLAGMLSADWTCSYREVKAATDDVLAAIVQESPNLVAVSVLTASVLEAYAFAARSR